MIPFTGNLTQEKVFTLLSLEFIFTWVGQYVLIYDLLHAFLNPSANSMMSYLNSDNDNNWIYWKTIKSDQIG